MNEQFDSTSQMLRGFYPNLSDDDMLLMLGDPNNFYYGGKTCREEGCSYYYLGSFQDYCDEHKKNCYSCDQQVPYLGNYCPNCLNEGLSNCSFANCTAKGAKSPYCFNHKEVCKHHQCSGRRSWKESYCPSHKNTICPAIACGKPKVYQGEYCSDHLKKCLESSCQGRAHENSNYCLSHYLRCSEDSCSTRISAGEDCCLTHQVRICQAIGCNKGIGKVKPRKTDWVEKTLFGKEKEGYLIKQAKRENLCRDHQLSFLMNTCNVLDCEEGKIADKYCKKHNNGCVYEYDYDNEFCPSRISNDEKYCYLHSKTCLNCSERILFSQNHCFKHVNQCSSCPQRVSYHDKICSLCQQQQNKQNQLKRLVKQRSSITGNIEEVTRFTTWWSKENTATIITQIK